MRWLSQFYNKHYKLLLLIPLILIVLSFAYLGIFYKNNRDILKKDISLTGGTSVTIYEKANVEELKVALSKNLGDLNVREIYDLRTREQKAIIVETTSGGEIAKKSLEQYFGFELIDGENSNFELTGSTLSNSFYKQLLIAILIAFLLMAIVIFIIFRNFVPSIAVIISAFADILMTLVLVNILGVKISTAGIVAFLMLIGYSVDTDILLTTRVLRRTEGSLNHRIFRAFKTGITMTLASLL